MVDDLEARLTRYRSDLDAAVAADFAGRDLASREARFHDAEADPLLVDAEYQIRLEPSTTPARYDGRRRMLVATLGIAAVTTVVLVALVAAHDGGDGKPADQPGPTVTVPTMAPPQALSGRGRAERDMVAGTYFFGDEVDGAPTERILVTIGSGWSIFDLDGTFGKDGRRESQEDDVGYITFSRPDRVFSDACHWSDGYYPGSVTTLDGLVRALSEQGGWIGVTAPSDISVDGYPGKAFQRTAPAAGGFSNCNTMMYSARSWPEPRNGLWPAFRSWESEPESFGGSIYEPGQIETLWVVDIDGTIAVINTNLFPRSSAADRAEFAAVLDSIRIDRG